MVSRWSRRSLVQASLATLTTASLVSCIPSLGPRKRPVVNVGLITYPNGFQPSFIPLYQAALAVTKAHAADFDINVNMITVTPPTPGAKPTPSKFPSVTEPLTVSALEQAMNQEPPPDVVLFTTDFDFGFALQKNLLQPIDQFLRGDGTFKKSDYFPGAVSAASDQGQLYGLPLAVQPTVLQYDKRLFDAAHLDPPDSTWTWTTLLNAAKTLTKPDAENGGQFALNLLNNVNVIPIFIWQNGGDLVSPDGRRSLIGETPAMEAIKFVDDLINTYKVVAVPPKSPGGSAPGPIPRPAAVYRAGESPPLMGPGGQRVAMSFSSYGAFGYGGFAPNNGQRPIRLAELFRGKSQATLLNLNGVLAVTQKASDPRAAYQVMALLAQSMEKQMNVPAYRPDAKNLSKQNPSISEDDAKVLVASLEYARTLPIMIEPIVGPLLYREILQPIQNGDKTPEEIARGASQTFDQALNQ